MVSYTETKNDIYDKNKKERWLAIPKQRMILNNKNNQER